MSPNNRIKKVIEKLEKEKKHYQALTTATQETIDNLKKMIGE